jgi:hypothetical protein
VRRLYDDKSLTLDAEEDALADGFRRDPLGWRFVCCAR